jgi:hypothetical protein
MNPNTKIRISGYRFVGIKDVICPELGETTWKELSKVLTPEERIVAIQNLEMGESFSIHWGNGITNYNLISQEEMIST